MLPPVVREHRLPHGDGLRQGLTVEKHDASWGGVVAADRHGMPFRPVLRLRSARAPSKRGASPASAGRSPSGRTGWRGGVCSRSEEHTSELQSLMRISYAVFCLHKKNKTK